MELLRIQPFGWFTCSSIRPTLSAHTQALRAAPSVRGAGRGLRAGDLLCNCAFCVASIVQTIYTASTIVPPSLSDLLHPLKQIACSQGSLTPVLMVVNITFGARVSSFWGEGIGISLSPLPMSVEVGPVFEIDIALRKCFAINEMASASHRDTNCNTNCLPFLVLCSFARVCVCWFFVSYVLSRVSLGDAL